MVESFWQRQTRMMREFERHEPRIGHGMMTKSRPGNFNGNSSVEKSVRAARELVVAMKMLARLNSRPPPPRKVA
jgi:hypothetical protein